MYFVTTTVHPKDIVNINVSKNQLEELLDFASVETENIRKDLMDVLFNHHRQSEAEDHQSVIIRLLNDLLSYEGTCKEYYHLSKLYQSLIDLLLNVLNHIETYFFKYFNVDEKIPQIYYLLCSENFQKQIGALSDELKGRLADWELIGIITSYYLVPGSGLYKNRFTFRDLTYRKELVKELNEVISETSNHKTVSEVLLYLNFNHIEFFKYLTDKLQEESDKFETLDAKLESLKYSRKLFRQMFFRENFALFSELPSIKEQVVNWIEEEIIFLESRITPVIHFPVKKDIVAVSKVSVALSVAQLAFLIKVLTLGKIITNHNQADVIRIFAANFKTSKTEDISNGSLYGKYFKPEPSTIKEVKNVLLQLVSLITKMKE